MSDNRPACCAFPWPGLTPATANPIVNRLEGRASAFRTDEIYVHTYPHPTGSTFLHLTDDAMRSFKFKLPSRELASALSQFSGQVFKRLDGPERESSTFAALRHALLSKPISGAFCIKDAKRFLKEKGL